MDLYSYKQMILYIQNIQKQDCADCFSITKTAFLDWIFFVFFPLRFCFLTHYTLLCLKHQAPLIKVMSLCCVPNIPHAKPEEQAPLGIISSTQLETIDSLINVGCHSKSPDSKTYHVRKPALMSKGCFGSKELVSR